MSTHFDDRDAELLAACDVETFCAGGNGGQNVNRRSTAVRLRHRESGIMVVCQNERSQYQNKIQALETLRLRLAAKRRRPKKRLATRPSAGSRERRLEAKTHRAGIKRDRRSRPDEA